MLKKMCPDCGEVVNSNKRKCPKCSYKFPRKDRRTGDEYMEKVKETTLASY